MNTHLLLKAAALALALQATAATASDDLYAEGIDSAPSAGAMAFDLVVIRPLSLVATVLGSGLFVLNLPLAAIQREAPSVSAEKLVAAPARYTFTRPLGQME